MILIPAGEFVMGSDFGPPGEDSRPPHHVKVSKPFYLGSHEVTQGLYESVMGTNPSRFSDKPDHPVDSVRWIDAIMFCNKLSEREGISPYYRIRDAQNVAIQSGEGYRLPTEAEWEYACRAGDPENLPFRDDESLGRFAWIDSNSERTTHPVGRKTPNAFGLYDMYGNVWEWCWDWVGPYPASLSIDPTGPDFGKRRALRGNAWWNARYDACRPWFRLGFRPDGTSPNHDFGFRIAADHN